MRGFYASVSSALPAGAPRPVKGGIFAQFFRCGKNHNLRKSRKKREGCRIFLCEPKVDIHNPHPLWKTLVEKLVENVENYGFSTGIPLLSKTRPSCGKVCIPPCIIPGKVSEGACYVTAALPGFSGKISDKSLQIVKIRCHFLFPFGAARKIFVKNRQRTFWVSTLRRREYFSYPISTGGTPCREK